jgi:hypothetical protein
MSGSVSGSSMKQSFSDKDAWRSTVISKSI